eukprot:1527178-Pleurochrysis_carterae.AAC.5
MQNAARAEEQATSTSCRFLPFANRTVDKLMSRVQPHSSHGLLHSVVGPGRVGPPPFSCWLRLGRSSARCTLPHMLCRRWFWQVNAIRGKYSKQLKRFQAQAPRRLRFSRSQSVVKRSEAVFKPRGTCQRSRGTLFSLAEAAASLSSRKANLLSATVRRRPSTRRWRRHGRRPCSGAAAACAPLSDIRVL